MAKKLPPLPLDAERVLSDERLRSCSGGARGLWIEMMCLMHRNHRRGYLQVAGQPMSPEQLARLTGRSADEASQQLAELLNAGVFSVTDKGTIFDRATVSRERKRKLCSQAGKRGGGNPALNETYKGTPKGAPKGRPKGGFKGGGVARDNPLENNGLSAPATARELFPPDPPPPPEKEREGSPHTPLQEKEKLTPPTCAQGKGVSGGKPEPEGFPEFWAAYPRKTAKKAARKAWERLRPDGGALARMLEALERQKLSGQWRKGVIPHPATWLNGERWEDAAVDGDGPRRGESFDDVIDRLSPKQEGGAP